MSRVATRGFFFEGLRGSVFVLERLPSVPQRGSVLIVPPFGEEMNKCRRMISEVSRRLAGAGFRTISPDHFGTGDSAGDFEQATLETWRKDLETLASSGFDKDEPFHVIAVRWGALLAIDLSTSPNCPVVRKTVLWQPVLDGSQHLAQFLRIRTMAEMTKGRKVSAGALMEEALREGRIEIAGYTLSAEFLTELSALKPIRALPASLGEVCWVEVVSDEGDDVSIASKRVIEGSALSREPIGLKTLVGEPFWMSTETVSNDSVIDSTVGFISAPSC